MSSEKRKYELKVRAERQRETRERIVAATVALHEEVGPARTTVSEIARRAGVQRLTVYNSFPDEQELFGACQRRFLAEHPPPDPAPALAIEDPGERLRTLLEGFYRWYRETETMSANVQRDRATLPELDALLARTIDAQIAALIDSLAGGWGVRGRRRQRLRAAIAVALDFWTWRRMAQEGLDDVAAAELMVDAAHAAVASDRAPAGRP